MSRDLGQPVNIRVVSNSEQFQRWWPGFVQSIGMYPVIGMNCKWNNANIVKQMARLGLNIDSDPQPPTQRQIEEWKAGGYPEIEGDTDLDFQPRPGQDHPMKNRDSNVKQGRVSLIQLASFGGNVVLFRSCFFDKLPVELMSLLQGRYVKVGQGLEKDRKRLLESYMVTPSNMVDVRQTCVRWPYFTADFDFDRFGIRSIAKWLFGKSYSDVCTVSPYWITHRLEEEQIRAVAEEVQLYVDIFTVVMLRYFGWTLPRNWMKSDAFGQIMYYWSAPLFEKAFLDSKFRATPIKDVAVTAAKRRFNHQFLKRMRQEFNLGKGTLTLATLWAWPIPYVQSELEKMLTREPGAVLPCSGYPMVAIDLSKILKDEDFEEEEHRTDGFKKVSKCIPMVGRWTGESGQQQEYRIRVTITTVDEATLDGADGGGPPLDVETAFAEESDGENENGEGDAERVVKEALPRIEAAATHGVAFLAQQMEWNRLKAATLAIDTQNLEDSTENENKKIQDYQADGDQKTVNRRKSADRIEGQEISETSKETGHKSRYEEFYGSGNDSHSGRGEKTNQLGDSRKTDPNGGDGDSENQGSEEEAGSILSSGPFVLGPRDAGLSFLKPVWSAQDAFANGEGSYARGNGRNFEFETLDSGGTLLAPESDCGESVVSGASNNEVVERGKPGPRSPRGIWRSGGRGRAWNGGSGRGYGRGTFTNTYGASKFRGGGGGNYRGGRTGFDPVVEDGEAGCQQFPPRDEKRFYDTRNRETGNWRERPKEFHGEQQSNRFGVRSTRGYSRARGSGLNVNRNRNESVWDTDGGNLYQQDGRSFYSGNGANRAREYNYYPYHAGTGRGRSFTPRKTDIFGIGYSYRGKNNNQLDQGSGGSFVRRVRGNADHRGGCFLRSYDRGGGVQENVVGGMGSSGYRGRGYSQTHYTAWNRGGGSSSFVGGGIWSSTSNKG